MRNLGLGNVHNLSDDELLKQFGPEPVGDGGGTDGSGTGGSGTGGSGTDGGGTPIIGGDSDFDNFFRQHEPDFKDIYNHRYE